MADETRSASDPDTRADRGGCPNLSTEGAQ